MTVAAELSEISYTASGATASYDFPFTLFDLNSDIAVTLRNSSGQQVASAASGGGPRDYIVSATLDVDRYDGGTVIFNASVPAGYTLTIRRVLPEEQDLPLTPYVAPNLNSLELSLDKIVSMIQDLATASQRALTLPPGFPAVNMLLPTPIAGAVLAWDVVPNRIVNISPSNVLVAGSQVFTRASIGALLYDTTAPELAAGVTIYDGGYPPMDIRRYGVVDTSGVVACTTALRAAISVSEASGGFNATVHVPHGTLLIDGKITIHQGVMIVGPGSQGSTRGYGTTIWHASNLDCFYFDGNGASNAGTGGGLKNLLILKKTGFAGGVAINIVATDDNHRPGEMELDNVLVYSEDVNGWTRCMVVDGTACNTPGGRGVRTINCNKVRLANVSTAGETLVLNQVSHFYSRGMGIDQGNGAAAGILIKGITDGVYFSEAGIGGLIKVVTNDASNTLNNFHFQGKCTTGLECNDALVDGVFLGSGVTSLLNKSPNLKCMTNRNPYVNVKIAVTVADVTGDGTVVDIPYDTERTDANGNFASTTFTCDCAGDYEFTVTCSLAGLLVGHTRADLTFVRAGSVAEAQSVITNPYAVSVGGIASLSESVTFRLAYGDTVKTTIAVTGSTKTVDLVGAATDYCKLTVKYSP